VLEDARPVGPMEEGVSKRLDLLVRRLKSTDTAIYTLIDELKKFDLPAVEKKVAVFNEAKMQWLEKPWDVQLLSQFRIAAAELKESEDTVMSLQQRLLSLKKKANMLNQRIVQLQLEAFDQWRKA
jgi:hypothetical protein